MPSPDVVLLVSKKRLEFFVDSASGRSGSSWSVLDRADESARALATAAKLELARLGQAGAPVILALDADMCSSRRVALPPIPPRERPGIWARRAASQLECEVEDSLYVAIPLSRGQERTDEEGEPWMLHALRRSVLVELQLELRRVGHTVRRVVVARIAMLARATQLFGGDPAAFLLIARERDANTLNLLRDRELIQQSVLQTAPGSSDQAMAVALVQELRQVSAYWRRTSRGGQLGRLLLMGFAEASLEPLVAAIRAALGGVEISFSPATGLPEPEDPRLEMPRACRVQGAMQVDLQVSLAPRKSRTILTALLLVGLAVATARPLLRDGTHRLEATRERLAALASAGAQLEELQERQALGGAARDGLAREVQHWTRVTRECVPAESLLPDVLESIAGRADLVSLRAHVEMDGVQVQINGRTSGETRQALGTLEEFRRSLSEHSRFADVRVLPPTRIPSSLEALDFSLTFRLEGE